MTDICIVSSDLFSDVLDFRMKRGAEFSTDYRLLSVFGDFRNFAEQEIF